MIYNPGMFELPLFPLNTVLFPGLPLKLNIFEPRYKQMLNRCLQNSESFGVVLIQHGREALGPLAEPYRIGCTAQLVQVEQTPDERFNVTAIGRERFRIFSLDRITYTYLTGMVEIFPFEDRDNPDIHSASRQLRPWVKRYFDVLSEASNMQMESRYLPNDPLALAFLAAYLLQMPPGDKQKVLEIERADQMIAFVHKLYRREVALMSAMLKQEGDSKRGFRLN